MWRLRWESLSEVGGNGSAAGTLGGGASHTGAVGEGSAAGTLENWARYAEAVGGDASAAVGNACGG
jgi:hypothetical protein